MYPLAKQGIYLSIQGEGALVGVPMTFVRLAGCSVGCPLCDTDYAVEEKVDADEILRRIETFRPATTSRWVWVTGGEPCDHNLAPLLVALKRGGWRPALATSGAKPLLSAPWDWLSVSPHDPRHRAVTVANELKLVPGLNGHRLADLAVIAEMGVYRWKYVIPCEGDESSRLECLSWVNARGGWRLGVQSHKQWGIA